MNSEQKKFVVALVGGLGGTAWAYVKGNHVLTIVCLVLNIVGLVGYVLTSSKKPNTANKGEQ